MHGEATYIYICVRIRACSPHPLIKMGQHDVLQTLIYFLVLSLMKLEAEQLKLLV